MSEVQQLIKRIDESKFDGIPTAHIRDDYEPAGDMMMRDLCADDNYVQRKVPPHSFEQEWRIFNAEFKPY